VQRRGNSQRLPGEFALVMVGVRGDNAQGYEYHRELVSGSRGRPVQWLMERRSLLRWWLDDYEIEAGGLWVCGVDGVAFRYTPAVPPADLPDVGQPQGINRISELLDGGPALS